ncbi:MAG: sulfate transporter CysZ [Gammaproteobacteria bacterium]
MTGAVKGAGYFIRGLALLRAPGVRRWVAIPLAINTVLFAAAIALGAQQFGQLVDWLLSFLPGWLDWLQFLLWPLFALFALVVTFFAFTVVANLVGAPFNGLLAEAVERHLRGAPPVDTGGWAAVLRDALPALVDELRKLAYFLLWGIPLLLLTLVPVVNLAAPFLWAWFSAWMLALEYGDYPMGNHGLRFAEQRRRLRRRLPLTLGFGAAVAVATLVPLFNFLVMPAAVAGASALWSEQLAE